MTLDRVAYIYEILQLVDSVLNGESTRQWMAGERILATVQGFNVVEFLSLCLNVYGSVLNSDLVQYVGSARRIPRCLIARHSVLAGRSQ